MIERVMQRDAYPANTVLTYFLAVLRAVCGYYIPMSAHVLWWAVGIGSLFLRLLYLQYLWSTHFFFDVPVARIVDRAWLQYFPGQCHSVPCYNTEGQDMASFFFVAATHGLLYRRRIGLIRTIVFAAAFAVYVATMLVYYEQSVLSTVSSFCIGAVLGVLKVLVFASVADPLCRDAVIDAAVRENARKKNIPPAATTTNDEDDTTTQTHVDKRRSWLLPHAKDETVEEEEEQRKMF